MDFSLLPTDHFLSLGKTKEPNINHLMIGIWLSGTNFM
nr:MAG TPA: hypothetical protein [Caudoviricetes sp.]